MKNELINKFFAREITNEEMDLLKSWLEQDKEARRTFNEVNELWQKTGDHSKLDEYNSDKAWMNISSKLNFKMNSSRSVTIIKKNNFIFLMAAATVACLVAIGGISLWITGKKFTNQITANSTIVTTDEGEKAHIFLTDSTEIILNSGSTLEYNGQYNIKDRLVKFTGEAFFNVRTNREKPFVVQLGKMSITATGTRFNIFSYGNEDRIETTLVEGVIQVSIKDREPIHLKSGQQVVYYLKSDKVLVHDVQSDTFTSWKENKLRFYDTPFEEVMRSIARKYNVEFKIKDNELLDLKYTATFINESIEEVMQMLKTVSPITYKIYDRNSVNDSQYLKRNIIVGKSNHFQIYIN